MVSSIAAVSPSVSYLPMDDEAPRSPIQQVASGLAESLAQAGANLSPIKIDNTIYAQLRGNDPEKILAENAEGGVYCVAEGPYAPSVKVERFLPLHVRQALQLESTYSKHEQKKFGLLRSPLIDEFDISNHQYNFSMAHEALLLGAHLRSRLLNGVHTPWESLWGAARDWRVGRLNALTDEAEIKDFSRERTGKTNSRYITYIVENGAKYGHLIKVLVDKLLDIEEGSALPEDVAAFQQRDLTLKSGLNIKLVSLCHSTLLQGQPVSLTELRTTLTKERGIEFPNVWAHERNAKYSITDDHFVQDFDLEHFDTYEGIMVHTRQQYRELFAQEIQQKLDDYSDFLTNHKHESLLKQIPLRQDIHSSELAPVLEKLGDIHYLLVHAVFDYAGSSSKSELFVRSLAAAAGIELPAFGKGFVPDLNAFFTSRDRFVREYADSFEVKNESVNVILGQLEGFYPHQILAQTQRKDRSQVPPFVSKLSVPAQRRVGLLRSPAVKEELLEHFDYNVSMVQEALYLGKQWQSQYLQGDSPKFNVVWEACRTWRVGRLDAQSSADEIRKFSVRRVPHECLDATPIQPDSDSEDIRYGHLVALLVDKAKQGQAQKFRAQSDVVEDRISFSTVVQLKGQDIHLTELRTVVDESGKPLHNQWAMDANLDMGDTSPTLTDKELIAGGYMHHTKHSHLVLIEQALQEQLQSYGASVQTHLGNSTRRSSVLTQLANMHYLLAHAMFDQRGSAAKSELLIRGLAVAAGFELPPFKAGFVPDLHAFTHTLEQFIPHYLHSFDDLI